MAGSTRSRRHFSIFALAATLILSALVPAAPALAYSEVRYANGVEVGWGVIRASTQGTISGGRMFTAGALWTVRIDTWRPDADFVVWSATGTHGVSGTHPATASVRSRCLWRYAYYVSGTQPLYCWKRVP